MRNQPLNPDLSVGDPTGDSLIDPPAAVRFRSLTIFFFVAACIVLSRISWVKANLQQRYLSALNKTTTEYELIPARDGRILSEAADVFATDVEQYSVQVHYRWLQDPVDEGWLQRQIRSHLSRSERSNTANIDQLTSELIQHRTEMWNRLADANDMSEPEFSAKRQAVQERVSRIADSVNVRRDQVADQSVADESGEGILLKLAAGIRSSLTTAPRRELERIVVREEESYHELVADVPLSTAGMLREQSHLFPGVRVVAGSRRTYPLLTVAAHVVGARTAATEQDSQVQPQTFLDGGWQPRPGRFGVERSYDHQLRSVPGSRRIVRNRRMEIVESEVERQPVAGRDVLLTLNVSLQKHAEQLLAEALLDYPLQLLANDEDVDAAEQPQPVPTGGCIVVMEVATGRIIAAASAPTFGLSLFTGSSSADWDAVNQDQRHPFLFRATSMAIPPGSVMKPLSAVAAIESGGLNPDAPFYCQGYLRQPDAHRCLIFRLYSQGHNDITLSRAIAQSCNVYFFAAAQKMGFKPLRHWCDRFGLGRPTGIDLPSERSGNLPDGDRVENEALGLAIGQSSLTVTPLQMTRAMAAIANGGWLVTPHVVSPDGTARTTADVDDRPRELTRRRLAGLTEGTLERIREGLRAVVEEPYGSGHKTVRLDEVAIAGKTGTAENGGGRPDHAWFAGYVPADQPQYAFVVVLEHGGSGSRAAGPLARELVRKMVDLGLASRGR
jgi:penicillin-binding protein 2